MIGVKGRSLSLLTNISKLSAILEMFRLVVIALTVSCIYGYGAPAGLALEGGFSGGLALNSGYGSAGLALNNGYGAKAVLTGPITAAIQSTRSYEVVPVALNYEAPVPQTIDVGPNIQPLAMIWRTQSSPLNLEQVHTPAAGQHESTRSEDEASVITHESYKPVVQEFREVIQPHRKIEQRIEPVVEHVHTVVAKGEEYVAPAIAKVAPLPLATPVVAKAGYRK